MAKVEPIRFEYEDKPYELMFTRSTIAEMERSNGFSITDVENHMVSTIMALWDGAFLAKHRRVSKAKRDEIWNAIGDKSALMGRLVELYKAPVEAMLSEPEDVKNVIKWH
jgi:hypothetical protein